MAGVVRLAALTLGALATLQPQIAYGACNIIPPAIQPFRAMVGTVDRPFAGPGDWLELGPDRCTQIGGFPDPVDGITVTVLFTPPAGGTRTALLLTPDDCASPSIQAQLTACAAR